MRLAEEELAKTRRLLDAFSPRGLEPLWALSLVERSRKLLAEVDALRVELASSRETNDNLARRIAEVRAVEKAARELHIVYHGDTQALVAQLRAELAIANAALTDKAHVLQRYAALLDQNVALGKDRDELARCLLVIAEESEARGLIPKASAQMRAVAARCAPGVSPLDRPAPNAEPAKET